MQELIKIEKRVIGAEDTNSVNARDIHEYLKVKTVFANWIQRAIKKYDFLENVDYVRFSKNGKAGNNAVTKEYIVTMDMAKELSMLENNAKGKETRKYFIAVEKEYKETLHTNSNDTLVQMLSILIENQNKMMELLIENQTQQKLLVAQSLTPEQLTNFKLKVLKAAKPLADVHNFTMGRAIREVYIEINGRMGVLTYYQITPADYDEAIEHLAVMKKQKEDELTKLKAKEEKAGDCYVMPDYMAGE